MEVSRVPHCNSGVGGPGFWGSKVGKSELSHKIVGIDVQRSSCVSNKIDKFDSLDLQNEKWEKNSNFEEIEAKSYYKRNFEGEFNKNTKVKFLKRT